MYIHVLKLAPNQYNYISIHLCKKKQPVESKSTDTIHDGNFLSSGGSIISNIVRISSLVCLPSIY